MSSDAVPSKEEDDIVLKKLKKTKAQASIWDLFMASKKHKDALVKELDDNYAEVTVILESSINDILF